MADCYSLQGSYHKCLQCRHKMVTFFKYTTAEYTGSPWMQPALKPPGNREGKGPVQRKLGLDTAVLGLGRDLTDDGSQLRPNFWILATSCWCGPSLDFQCEQVATTQLGYILDGPQSTTAGVALGGLYSQHKEINGVRHFPLFCLQHLGPFDFLWYLNRAGSSSSPRPYLQHIEAFVHFHSVSILFVVF